MTRRRFTMLGTATTTLVMACGTTLQPIAARSAPTPVVPDTVIEVTPDNRPSDGGSASPASDSSPAVVIPDSLDASARRAMAEAAKAIGLDEERLFAALSAPRPPAGGDADDEVSWDIDVTSYATHDQVTRYMNLFTGPARERIQSRLQRGKRYEPMIREKFRRAGIPEDMYYLALVESGYDPHAYSRAAAVGMWQFMTSTARGVGLRVDHWVDERRDPARATDAAARFLTSLHNQFGSYYLAAAAYNGGPGRVSRGLARFQDELQELEGDDQFFALAEQSYLRAETRNYVPQLIAAALIGKEPARYGMAITDSVPRYAYDSARVQPLTAVATIARAAGVTPQEARDLNPALLRGVTPPGAPIWVRIPEGRAAAFDSAWATLSEEDRRAFIAVRTGAKQTLTSIARAHGVDARRLSWYNPQLSTTRRLPTGTTVHVPVAAVLAAARDVPSPSIERYGSSASGGRVVHVVRRGESLGLIARRYRTSVTALQRVNGLRRTVVYPGQTIIVRTSARRSTAARGRATTSTRKTAPAKRTTVKRAAAKPSR